MSKRLKIGERVIVNAEGDSPFKNWGGSIVAEHGWDSKDSYMVLLDTYDHPFAFMASEVTPNRGKFVHIPGSGSRWVNK